MSTYPPALDLSRLADLRSFGGDDTSDLALEVAQLFLELSPEGMRELTLALAAGKTPQVASEAHRLRGSAGNIGATPLAELLLDVERAVKEQGHARADLIEPLRAELDRVLTALRAEFDLAG